MQNVQQKNIRSAELIRGISLPGAVSINMIDMIGVGPFITIPLIVAAMGGPQAMLGWILGAVLAMCDGLVPQGYGGTHAVQPPGNGERLAPPLTVTDVPMYQVDALVRRAPSLQRTRDGRAPAATY